MRRDALLTVLLWIACATLTLAQTFVVSGRVEDAATGRSIAGAGVTARGAGVAVVTNDDGAFTLKCEGQPEQLVVSHLGYQAAHVSLQGADTQQLVVRLHPASIQLQELLVRSGSARDLVNAALQRIPHNYSSQPQLYRCFYRETAMKRQHYVTVAEGVVDMYKTAYATQRVNRDRVAIRKGRRLLSPRSGDTLSVKVLGGPVAAVQLDVVKNPDFLFTPEELDCYDMRLETPTVVGDRRQYVVAIEPRRIVGYALQHGRLYIDQETLAFTRIELSLDMKDREKATRVMLVRKPAGVRFRPRELSFLVDYRMGDDGVMHLSYQRTTFRFNCDWRRRLFATSFAATCELAVTGRESRPEAVQPIRGRESFDSRDAFFDKVEFFLDPAFWLDYNIIEPTESLDKAVDRLLKRR